MDPYDIYRSLAQKPFQPMRVVCKDGRTYDIPLRELVVVGLTYVDIGFQAPGQAAGICASFDIVEPQDILRVEPITARPMMASS
jgi:hypothetical protein